MKGSDFDSFLSLTCHPACPDKGSEKPLGMSALSNQLLKFGVVVQANQI